MAFTGFTPATFQFFAGLVHNNERAWFEAHREDYARHVVEPALALIADLDPIVQTISPHYRGVAKKQGGSLMRIFRDTRFSRDKTPYKTNIGIQLRHEAAADVHAPGFYLHLDLQECFLGSGTWHPEPADLLKIRQRVALRPEEYRQALADSAAAGLKPAGDSLAKVPRGFAADHPLASELKRKDFLVSADLDPELFLGPGLVPVLEERFRASAAYMKFLCAALDAPF